MTTLDQAFVKAFSRQNTVPLAVLPRPAAPKDAEAARGHGPEARDQGAEARGQGSGSRVVKSPIPSFQPLASNPQSLAPSPQSLIPNPQPLAPNPLNPSLPDSLWAALEIPLKEPESVKRKAEEVASAQLLVASESAPTDHSAFNSQHSPSDPQSLVPNLSLPVFPITCPPSPPQRDFKPAWQVDHFTWPRLCRRLMARAADELDRLADAMLAISRQGQKVLAIGGCCRGEGATTLLLCAARRLAERGVKSVLVDADLGRPRLAKRLGVQPQFGWDETLSDGGPSLDEAIVEATANNVALLPAREPASECGGPLGDPSRLPDCLKVLKEHYDLVMVDLGPLENAVLADGARSEMLAEGIDAVILVHGPQITSESQRIAVERKLAAAGIAVAGIVENFVAE
jgi:Mrp family chromosome partitioning ATPase